MFYYLTKQWTNCLFAEVESIGISISSEDQFLFYRLYNSTRIISQRGPNYIVNVLSS